MPKTVGSVQYGKRPILCLGNVKGLSSCGNINYIILTSKLDKRRLIVHHQLSKNKYSFLKCDSTVACETISTISKECDLPVAPQDEDGLTTTFQTWPRGWFHIPKDPDFPVPS